MEGRIILHSQASHFDKHPTSQKSIDKDKTLAIENLLLGWRCQFLLEN